MNVENYPAENLTVGDVIRYRDLYVTVTSDQEPDDNQFGLPWFRYRVEAEDGRWDYARFGPGGHAAKVVGERVA